MREEISTQHSLAGDRAIEWSWIVKHLPTRACRILDLGCVDSVLTGIASRLGHYVTAVDLRDIEYEMPRVTFCKGDINELKFDNAQFDMIMNCSMIEHVGLDGRYGSSKKLDGDIALMKKLRTLLAHNGLMIMTIPVGCDDTVAPYHRIYGMERLPKLLDAYNIFQEEYWTKNNIGLWTQCVKETALLTQGSDSYYSLGLFLIGKKQ
jgi:SAM-dependent methyltransferase